MSKITDSKGREVEITVYGKYEDDIEISTATYVDDDSDLPEEEVDHVLNHYQDAIYEMWYENRCGAAEAFAEGDR